MWDVAAACDACTPIGVAPLAGPGLAPETIPGVVVATPPAEAPGSAAVAGAWAPSLSAFATTGSVISFPQWTHLMTESIRFPPQCGHFFTPTALPDQ